MKDTLATGLLQPKTDGSDVFLSYPKHKGVVLLSIEFKPTFNLEVQQMKQRLQLVF